MFENSQTIIPLSQENLAKPVVQIQDMVAQNQEMTLPTEMEHAKLPTHDNTGDTPMVSMAQNKEPSTLDDQVIIENLGVFSNTNTDMIYEQVQSIEHDKDIGSAITHSILPQVDFLYQHQICNHSFFRIH